MNVLCLSNGEPLERTQIVCPNCKSLLEYVERFDARSVYTCTGEYQGYSSYIISCPVCWNNIDIGGNKDGIQINKSN